MSAMLILYMGNLEETRGYKIRDVRRRVAQLIIPNISMLMEWKIIFQNSCT